MPLRNLLVPQVKNSIAAKTLVFLNMTVKHDLRPPGIPCPVVLDRCCYQDINTVCCWEMNIVCMQQLSLSVHTSFYSKLAKAW